MGRRATMRACINQYVKNGEIYCTGNNEPCDDLRPMIEKNLQKLITSFLYQRTDGGQLLENT